VDDWRPHRNRQFRLVSYEQQPGAGWIPAADIRESAQGIVTITPIVDRTRLLPTEDEANQAASAMAIAWIDSRAPR
jgi:hypothetical protein